MPEVTPSGKPANVGNYVATPAVPVNGAAVVAWMCDAVVVPRRPENVTDTCIVFAIASTVTVPVPVPGELFAGPSLPGRTGV